MTERLRSGSYANSAKMAIGGPDLSPKKTMIVLVIVVGCFAVLWPKVFYPMLLGSAQQRIKPSAIDRTTGCCDVISETDINTIKIMSELCKTIIKTDDNAPPLSGREIVAQCRKAVLETCGIDISAVLQEQVRLGQNTKQILHEIRSLNGSLCLKYNFGVSPSKLGVPHRITVKVSPSSVRQERPPHLRSEMVHPAFRERGRAIPQSQPSSPSRPPPKIVEGRPGPIPGLRPTMGGAGHVVPPKQSSTGTMGLIMPVYTIGIVIFFTYTVMKILFKKQPEALYPPVEPDPVFRREVFEANRGHLDARVSRGPSSKLVVNAMSALLDEVDQEIAARRNASADTEQDVMANGKLHHQEDQASVKVMGMEMTASCEGNKKWSRPDSPVLPTPYTTQSQQPKEPSEPPQEIYLEGALPPQSNHLLVADSATETQNVNLEEDPAVVLAGKMTLSVISLDSSENGTDESSGRKAEERSSSNVSDDFEKIELEDQINDIIQEAEQFTINKNLTDDETKQLIEKLDPETVEIVDQNVIDKIHKEISDIDERSDELEIQYTDENIEDILKKYTDEQLTDPTLDFHDEKLIADILEENKYDVNSLDPTLYFKDSANENVTLTDDPSEVLQEKTPENMQTSEISEEIKDVEEVVTSPKEETNLVDTQIVEESTSKETSGELEKPIEDSAKDKLDTDQVVSSIKEVVEEFVQKESTPSETTPVQVQEIEVPKDTVETKIEETSTDIVGTSTPSAIGGIDEAVIIAEDIVASVEKTVEDAQDQKTDQTPSDLQLVEEPVKAQTETEKEQELKVEPEDVPQQLESTEERDFRKIFDDLNAAVLDLSSELNPSRLQNVVADDKSEENVPRSPIARDENVDLDEPEDDEEEVEYEYEYEEESDSENIEDEIRDIERIEDNVNREPIDRVNGDHLGASSDATPPDRDISDEDHPVNENDDEDVEEIIEYISDDDELVEELEANNVNHINNDTESANQ